MTYPNMANSLKWFAIGIMLLIVSLSTVSYASSTIKEGGTTQTIAGEKFTLTGIFSIQSIDGPLITAISQSASPLITWSNGSSAHTEMTANHWQLQVTVRINAGAQPDTVFTITLEGSSGAVWNSFGSIAFITPTLISPGEEMTFIFGVGAEMGQTSAFVARIV